MSNPRNLADRAQSLTQDLDTTDSPEFAAATINGNITVSGTVDGRDIATNIPSSLGSAGQVLTVNSGASAAQWADASGGGECQVWAYVTMSGSTPTLQNDVGVSSITDLGVGRFDVAFSTTRSSQYYASSGSGWGGGDFIVNTRPSFNGATTKVAIYFNNDAGTLTDPTFSWSIMVAGGN